jgi:hypothetical protein
MQPIAAWLNTHIVPLIPARDRERYARESAHALGKDRAFPHVGVMTYHSEMHDDGAQIMAEPRALLALFEGTPNFRVLTAREWSGSIGAGTSVHCISAHSTVVLSRRPEADYMLSQRWDAAKREYTIHFCRFARTAKDFSFGLLEALMPAREWHCGIFQALVFVLSSTDEGVMCTFKDRVPYAYGGWETAVRAYAPLAQKVACRVWLKKLKESAVRAAEHMYRAGGMIVTDSEPQAWQTGDDEFVWVWDIDTRHMVVPVLVGRCGKDACTRSLCEF